MSNRRPKQSLRVLDYMEKNGSINPYEALLALGVMRLASRISELKRRGYEIESSMVPTQNRWGETCYVKQYSLVKEEHDDGRTADVR